MDKPREFWIQPIDKMEKCWKQHACNSEHEALPYESIHVIEFGIYEALREELSIAQMEIDRLKVELNKLVTPLSPEKTHEIFFKHGLCVDKESALKLQQENVRLKILNDALLDKLANKHVVVYRENTKLREALNKIAMLGSGADAYTSKFTNDVNGITRKALEKE
jgi:hypothetical protein